MFKYIHPRWAPVASVGRFAARVVGADAGIASVQG